MAQANIQPVSSLDTQLSTFARRQPELLQAGHRGKWVLIYGGSVAGVYESRHQGLRRGYQRFGNVPFLVREVREASTPVAVRSVSVIR